MNTEPKRSLNEDAEEREYLEAMKREFYRDFWKLMDEEETDYHYEED